MDYVQYCLLLMTREFGGREDGLIMYVLFVDPIHPQGPSLTAPLHRRLQKPLQRADQVDIEQCRSRHQILQYHLGCCLPRQTNLSRQYHT